MTGNTPNELIFHGSVTGASHKRRGTVCQDASGTFRSDDGSFRIAVIADGHGDPSCVRSDRGSKYAVKAALDCLQIFAKQYPSYADIEAASAGPGQRQVIRRLTGGILSEWAKLVKDDLASDPMSEEEYRRAGRFEEAYRSGEHAERIYGSTLAAALEGKDYFLLLQQGDGRCDLLYDDLTMQQPVPEDERCYANVTTSLSDFNAAEEIRGCIVTERFEKILGCLVSTDGVDNGFYDDEDLLQFYLDLCIKMEEAAAEDADESLRAVLEKVSAEGNGDDVSVAALCRRTLIRSKADEIRGSIEARRRDHERDQYLGRMVSMERKVSMLRERVRTAGPEEQDACMREYLEAYRAYQDMEAQAEKLRSK